MALQTELQALAAQIKARRDFAGPRLLRAEPVQAVGLRPYVTACALCGDPSDRATCAACDEGYRELGL